LDNHFQSFMTYGLGMEMIKARFCASLIAVLVLLGAQAPVRASTVTDDFSLTLNAIFGPTSGTGSLAITIPQGSTSGSVSGSDVTGDVMIAGVDISLSGSSLLYVVQGSSVLLTGVLSGQTPVIGGVDSIVSLTLGNNGLYFFSDTANASLNSSGLVSISQTPLPTSLPLLATGLGIIAMIGWYRKRKGGSYLAARA
jgi:hypothetical protein